VECQLISVGPLNTPIQCAQLTTVNFCHT